ncbi:DNA helicase-2/ATP-dependent DNA helicase PcrA [Bacillus fengqiuensis]|nr:DNA helicase-2/ATP-dependent DNA helicase PcrA [Bacillus fengqiuensis]
MLEHAIHQRKKIHLSRLSREKYQLIYEACLREEVTCQHCGEPVRLYLGIEQAPHFYHAAAPHSRAACEETGPAAFSLQLDKDEGKKEEHTVRNGFRLPKSRPIGAQPDNNSITWKHSTSVDLLPPFKKRIITTTTDTSPYIQSLKEKGIVLDAYQWEAVTTTEGPLLILAGAGSGKTRVLTARTAYMIQEKKIDPRSIMLVTFTAKAAKEMKQRLLHYPSMSSAVVQKLISGTFHSIFYKMIAHFQPQAWNMDRLLKWEWQKEQIVKEAGRELHLDEREFAYDQALQQISYWKNTLTAVQDVRPASQWEERVHYLYKHYEMKKQREKLFDFDDMLYGCYTMLKENPSLLARYQERLRYFLIDEFQDINKVQYEIMKMLSAGSANLCAVGDDDQSIYAFRGSNPSFILNFKDDFAGTKTVTLSENYRSSHNIVASANKVIALNKERHEKKMFAQFDNNVYPMMFFPYDEEEEATMIVTDIKEKIQQGAQPSDFSILYRTHSSSRAVFERLTQSNLPFMVEQDTESFYQRRIVRSMLGFLRLSMNPNDTKAMQDLLMSLFLKQSALNDVKAFSILNDVSLVKALTFLENLQPFQQKKLKKIVPLFASLKTLSPLAALEMIEKDMGFDEFVKKRGNEGNMMEKGSDDVRDLKVVARKFQSVSELIEHADHMTAMNKEMKQLSKQFRDSVQLSTIHRAKGLEYKYVYVLSSVDGGIPHDYALDSYRNGEEGALEEERRLLYVAMTRAQLSLYLSVPQTRRGKTAYPSRFIKPFLTKSPKRPVAAT